MQIADLRADDAQAIEQVAAILVAAFADHWPAAWPNLAAARVTVLESFGAERVSRVALDEHGAAAGWIGGSAQYHGHVWELHPLAVHPAWQGRGVGRALVADFEAQVRARGGLTIWLGTDDEDNLTSLSGVNLFPDVLDHAERIQNLRHHPFEFYQKVGFVIVGVLPDANGPGKPDIFMAKSVRRQA
jgi:aminoglycoside 6'-N-acetyltransferase I